MELKIGDRVWMFDANQRIYRDANGQSYRSPIWREHWRPMEVIGETPRSWVIGFPGSTIQRAKLSKAAVRRGVHPGWALSELAINRAEWVHDNRWRVAKAVERCGDFDTLRKIAALVGYEEKGRG